MRANVTVIDHGEEALTAAKRFASTGKNARGGNGDAGAGYLGVAAGKHSLGGAK